MTMACAETVPTKEKDQRVMVRSEFLRRVKGTRTVTALIGACIPKMGSHLATHQEKWKARAKAPAPVKEQLENVQEMVTLTMERG